MLGHVPDTPRYLHPALGRQVLRVSIDRFGRANTYTSVSPGADVRGARFRTRLAISLGGNLTPLPDDYETWSRVRDRGKLRAFTERGALVTEIEVSLMEFAAYAKGLKNPNFSIGALDQCAREKAIGQAQGLLKAGANCAISRRYLRFLDGALGVRSFNVANGRRGPLISELRPPCSCSWASPARWPPFLAAQEPRRSLKTVRLCFDHYRPPRCHR